jgi:WD40 repeat protein
MTKKTLMKRFYLLILILVWGLAGCQTRNLQPLTEKPIVSSPAATATALKAQVMPTVLPTATSLPTATPVPSATALPVSSLAEKGFLLIWDDGAKQYTVIDLNGGELSMIQGDTECGSELLPGTTTVICEHASGQHYLKDVFTGAKKDLPIWNASWISWSANGQFLVYSHNIDAGEPILSYQISTSTIETLTARLNLDWLELPVLSADGQTLTAARNYAARTSRIFEIVRGTSQYRQIGLDKPFSTGDIAWSPASRQLVYGATDIEQEIGPSPNYLYMIDEQTGKIQKLAKSPKPLFFWSQSLEWSPTGKQVAVGLWDLAFKSESQACVIDVSTTEQSCIPALRNIGGRFLGWSPSGEHIAFVDLDKNLILSNPDGTGAVKLLENIPSDFSLFWR